MLRRASRSLEEYEERLHLLARNDAAREKLEQAAALLEQGTAEQIEQAAHILKEIEL